MLPPMRLTVRTIDWEYPRERHLPAPELVDLSVESEVMGVYMALANGTLHEMRIDADCREALDVARGLICGAGAAVPIELTDDQKARLWLFDECYNVFRQAGDGFIFLNRTPTP